MAFYVTRVTCAAADPDERGADGAFSHDVSVTFVRPDGAEKMPHSFGAFQRPSLRGSDGSKKEIERKKRRAERKI